MMSTNGPVEFWVGPGPVAIGPVALLEAVPLASLAVPPALPAVVAVVVVAGEVTFCPGSVSEGAVNVIGAVVLALVEFALGVAELALGVVLAVAVEPLVPVAVPVRAVIWATAAVAKSATIAAVNADAGLGRRMGFLRSWISILATLIDPQDRRCRPP
jgi:hypothetical protein